MLVRLAEEYLQNVAKVFFCPSDRDTPPSAIVTADYSLPDSACISFDFYSPYWQPEYGPKIARLRSDTPVAWDLNGGAKDRNTKNHPIDGGNVAYADGHVELLNDGEWLKPNWPLTAETYYHR